MICGKCNSEIPEGAKFCISCGEPVKQNKFCIKCGSELLKSTRFCVNCGARLDGGDVKDDSGASSEAVKPAVQDIAEAEPVSYAVSADEPDFEIPVIAPVISEEAAEDNSAFDIGSPISLEKHSDSEQTLKLSDFADPAPTVQKPASVPTPVSSPSVSAYSSAARNIGDTSAPSFAGSPSSASNTGYIPQYDPSKTSAASSNAETPTVVSNAPAAAAVVNKSRKKPVIIAVVAVLVAALAAGVILCFANSATVLSTIMGKSNYAAMVEGNSIKQAAAMLDKGSLSSGIKTAAGVYASYTSMNGGALTSSGYSSDSLAMLLSDNVSGNSDVQSADLSSFFAALNSSIKDAYGVNSAVVTLGMNAELTDTAKTELKKSLSIDDDKLNELLEYINGTKLSAGITSGESSAALKAGVEVKGLKLDLKVLVNSKGDAYVVLPFASEKAILFKVGEAGSLDFSSSDDSAVLELDEKEIERFINEIVELYIESYKSAEIEMENGDLSVSGVSVSGKVLTAEFDSEMLEKLISDIGEKLAKDDYFKEKIVEYLNGCGVEITESEYEKAILDAVSELDINSSAKLKITTIINNSGNILGKSYKLSANGSSVKASYAETNSEFAFELKSEANGETAAISVKNAKESDTAGTATVKLVSDNSNVTFKIKYKDVKTEKFCGKDIGVGTYEISVSLPKDFDSESSLPANSAELLADTKLILSTAVDGNTCTSSIGVKSDKYGEVSLTYSLTAENNTSDLSEPSSFMDFTPYMDGEEPGEELKNELIEYLESVRDAIRKQNAGELGDAAADAVDELISSASKASDADVSELRNSISTGRNEVLYFNSQYGIYDSDLYEEVNELYKSYYDLYLDFTNVYYKSYSLTSEEYAEFKTRLDALEKEKNALEEKYRAAAGLPSGDFAGLNANEILSVLGEYKDKFNEILNNSNSMAKIEASSALKDKYDECMEIYSDAFNSALEAYREYIKSGTADEALLDSARSLLKDFADAYESLNSGL